MYIKKVKKISNDTIFIPAGWIEKLTAIGETNTVETIGKIVVSENHLDPSNLLEPAMLDTVETAVWMQDTNWENVTFYASDILDFSAITEKPNKISSATGEWIVEYWEQKAEIDEITITVPADEVNCIISLYYDYDITQEFVITNSEGLVDSTSILNDNCMYQFPTETEDVTYTISGELQKIKYIFIAQASAITGIEKLKNVEVIIVSVSSITYVGEPIYPNPDAPLKYVSIYTNYGGTTYWDIAKITTKSTIVAQIGWESTVANAGCIIDDLDCTSLQYLQLSGNMQLRGQRHRLFDGITHALVFRGDTADTDAEEYVNKLIKSSQSAVTPSQIWVETEKYSPENVRSELEAKGWTLSVWN